MNMSRWGDPVCGRHDLVFVGSSPRQRGPALEFVVVVLSNAFLLVPLWMLARRHRTVDVVFGAALIVSSTLYHACDTLQVDILMTAGNWHRLDNLFVLLSYTTLGALVLGPCDVFRATTTVVAIFFQELHPWHIACMALPLGYAFGFVWLCKTRRVVDRGFVTALFVQCLSLCCFVRGLREDDDPYRVFHGCWHILNAAAAALFINALEPSSRDDQRKTR